MSGADAQWSADRRLPQSSKCFETPLQLRGADITLPRSYIYSKRGLIDVFGPFAELAKSKPGWRYYEIDASHSPHVTAHERTCRASAGDRTPAHVSFRSKMEVEATGD